MKKYTVKITKMTYGHMIDIAKYISTELLAPDAANNLLDLFKEKILELSQMPSRHRFGR